MDNDTRLRSLGLSSAAICDLEALNEAAYLTHQVPVIERCVRLANALPAGLTDVEIGSNRGRFSLGMAIRYPRRPFLAIEWRDKWVRQARADAESEGLTNLTCLHADARVALPVLVPPGTLKALYVLFPDPWWKRKHEHRRLLEPGFLAYVGRLLEPGGRLIVKTDVRLVAAAVRTAASEVANLVELPVDRWPDEADWPLTTRERRCRRDGIGVYRVFLGRVFLGPAGSAENNERDA